MTSMFELGQQILAAQPFSGLLQARLTVFEAGIAELLIPIQPQLLQQYGFVHGGVLSYAADNALTFAGGSVLGAAVVTSEYKINYVKPAQGQTIIARASVIAAGKRQAVCRCDVFAVDGARERLCATALGTITTLSSPADPAEATA
jgi:uncharacterized protein (TIGR00369 family)